MSPSFFFPRVRLSGRIVGAAVLLLALSVTEFCSAAEVIFGGKYSLELPAGWTTKAGESKAVSGGTSGGVKFSANAFPTKDSPEALMEKVIVGNMKEAGYKSIEKGIVTSAAGRKAYLHRYQVDGKSGTYVLVEYYFQLVEKEVVALLFEFPSNISKSPKSEIEAIFDSVKVATAAGKDDSWLNSDSPAAGTPRTTSGTPPPAAPKTSGSEVTFGNCSVQLPAGWTAKAAGKDIEATGPGGASLKGVSEMSPMSVDLALAVQISLFEKMPGYELLDTDPVSTKAGAKGKLAYYRYNGKSGPVAGLAVIIEVAKNHIVTLRFLAPSASNKLDATFQNAVEAIFSSVKISK